jgi:GH18 family chitinase
VEDLDAWTVERDTLSKAPFAYKGNQWVSYDDETSVAFKVTLFDGSIEMITN